MAEESRGYFGGLERDSQFLGGKLAVMPKKMNKTSLAEL